MFAPGGSVVGWAATPGGFREVCFWANLAVEGMIVLGDLLQTCSYTLH